jgi:hypothetical protein
MAWQNFEGGTSFGQDGAFLHTANALMDTCSEHFHERILTISFMIQVWVALVCTLTRFELCYFSLGLIKGTGHRNSPNRIQELQQETFVSIIIYTDEVDFFNLPNHSSHTMALGSTHPLTEMSTRNLPGGG